MRSPSTPGECLLLGLALGSGPCLVSCAPVVVAYIAGTRSSWREGLTSVLLFSLGRGLAYLFLGAAAFGAYQTLSVLLHMHGVWLDRFLGIFLLANGFFFAWMERHRLRVPMSSLAETIAARSVLTAGVLTGLRPCLPVLAVIAYAGGTAGSAADAIGGVLLFSVGTTISPLVLIGAAAGGVPGIIPRDVGYARTVRVVAAVMLIVIGVYMLAQSR